MGVMIAARRVYRLRPLRQCSSKRPLMASPMPSWWKTTAVQVGRVITGSSSAIMPCSPSKTASFMGSDSAMRTATPAAMYSVRRWRCSSSSAPPPLHQQTAGSPARSCLFHQLFVEGIDGVGRPRKFHVLAFDFCQHAAVLRGGLSGLGDDAQEIERATAPASLGIERFEVFDEGAASAVIIGQILFEYLTLAPQVAGNRQTGLHRGEELRLLLHHLRKTLFHQAVEDLVDFLSGHVGTSRQFQRFELVMSQKHQVRPRFVRIEPKLLQSPPESLKVNFGQFLAHSPFHLTKARGDLWCQANRKAICDVKSQLRRN